MYKINHIFKMPAQAKISTYLSPTNSKRKLNECSTETRKKSKVIGEENPTSSLDNKSECVSSHSETCQSGKSAPISPEQKHRTNNNKLMESQSKGLLIDIGSSWYDAMKGEFAKDYIEELSSFIASERAHHTVYPPPHQVFTWTNMCAIKDVKVVILGQDPYHNVGQAHGLCFSVAHGVKPPPSLKYIYKELATDIPDFSQPVHGDLTAWATQGVLLLNAVLTVRAHQPNSHKNMGWETLTDFVISYINKHLSGVVFLLWGAYAHKKGSCINKGKHHVLKTVHPSPLSASKGFLGCRHFSETNTLLKASGKTPIDWSRFAYN